MGALFIVSENLQAKRKIATHVKRIIRALYSNPPSHGARLVLEILKRDELKTLWLKDLEGMRKRIHLMRQALIQRLTQSSKEIDFEYLKPHKGMFSFINMRKDQVQRMIDEFGVYMTDNGRLSITGLSYQNLDYVAGSLISCVRQ